MIMYQIINGISFLVRLKYGDIMAYLWQNNMTICQNGKGIEQKTDVIS